MVVFHPGFYLIPGVGALKTYSRLLTRYELHQTIISSQNVMYFVKLPE